jgi:molybdopterin-guanine dinucleotide biosynthesis protein A
MGGPKAALKFGNTTLLERTLIELGRSFDDIVVVAAPRQEVGNVTAVRVIHDEREYEGPARALSLGLCAIRNDAAFVCSCDLPLLNRKVAQSLSAMLNSYDAVIPEIAGLVQPLHAVYHKRCAAAIDTMLARGEKRLTKAVESLSVRRVREDELCAIDPELHSFRNINPREDYEHACRVLAKRP